LLKIGAKSIAIPVPILKSIAIIIAILTSILTTLAVTTVHWQIIPRTGDSPTRKTLNGLQFESVSLYSLAL